MYLNLRQITVVVVVVVVVAIAIVCVVVTLDIVIVAKTVFIAVDIANVIDYVSVI